MVRSVLNVVKDGGRNYQHCDLFNFSTIISVFCGVLNVPTNVMHRLYQDFAIYGTYVAEQSSGELASSLMYVSFFDIKNRKRSVNQPPESCRYQLLYNSKDKSEQIFWSKYFHQTSPSQNRTFH